MKNYYIEIDEYLKVYESAGPNYCPDIPEISKKINWCYKNGHISVKQWNDLFERIVAILKNYG